MISQNTKSPALKIPSSIDLLKYWSVKAEKKFQSKSSFKKQKRKEKKQCEREGNKDLQLQETLEGQVLLQKNREVFDRLWHFLKLS